MFHHVVHLTESLSQAPHTCDLCHMARSCSAYNAPHMVARALSLSLSFYHSEHMTLSTPAMKQKAPVSADLFFSTPNLHASQIIVTFSLECLDRVAILSHEQP